MFSEGQSVICTDHHQLHTKTLVIDDILTASEASRIWGLERSVVRKAIEREKFSQGEYRKSSGTWLVTAQGMERVFGNRDKK